MHQRGVRTVDLATLLQGTACEFRGDPATPVTGVAYDSRQVSSGQVFFCIPGTSLDGHHFAGDAVARGAAALVVGHWVTEVAVPQARVADPRRALGVAAANAYGHPSRHLTVVGVTGTNGKTTTAFLLEHVLREAGRRTGLLGTVYNKIGDVAERSVRTTPESADLQRYLSAMVRRDTGTVVMEVSSHALALDRLAGTEVDVAVFTNITHDHFDFHGSFRRYLAAKQRLFADLGTGRSKRRPCYGVVNRDDPHFAAVVAAATAPVISYGTHPEADAQAVEVDLTGQGSSSRVTTPWGDVRLRLSVPGRFNVANGLAALTVAVAEGVALDQAAASLEGVRHLPGRYEMVRAPQGYWVMIDFAHNPAALENILRTARGLTPSLVWVVFGCEGHKDRAKRPLMGQVAARWSDRCIVTSDNLHGEDPEAVAGEVEAGILASGMDPADYQVIMDRGAAIATALAGAQPGDVVVVAGKGHETQWDAPGGLVPFSDRLVVEELLGLVDQPVTAGQLLRGPVAP